jgi:S1-C subfamily serine protease
MSRRLYGDQPQEIIKFIQGEPQGAMLGVNIATGGAPGEGVRINGVSPGGPAEAAGLRAGDVLVAVDGVRLDRSGEQSPAARLTGFMRTVQPGQRVQVEYLRDGARRKAELAAAPAEPPIARVLRERLGPLQEQFNLKEFERLLVPERSFGSLELVTVTPKLGRYFGADRGLLVVRAPSDPSFRLEEGDVLLAIDGRVPESPAHAFRILRSYQPGEKLELEILRDRKKLELDVTVPEVPAVGGPPMPVAPLPPAPPSKRDPV